MSEAKKNESVSPERLDLESVNIVEEQKAKLKELFPEVVTEGGKIDFDRLSRTLGKAVDEGKERYGLTWAGKSECFNTIQKSSTGTLAPLTEKSVNFEDTNNIIIEGDNLEVLKLLQKGYLGKIKAIFIDPPYNTGNDFIYPDDFSESLDTYLQYSGQVNAEGKKFSNNVETDGRFHSKWLSMMYPRLFLARNLLREDGVIFISIDDGEVDNLKKICSEIFGEENFIAKIVWQKKQSPQNDATNLSCMHDYILVFARSGRQGPTDSGWTRNLLPRTEAAQGRYSNPDNDPRGPWTSSDYTCNKTADERPNLYYGIKNPVTGELVYPSKTRVWGADQAQNSRNEKENRLWWGKDGTGVPRIKTYLSEVDNGIVPTTWWTRQECGDNQESSREVRDLFKAEELVFDNPKPRRLIERILRIATESTTSDIVLDFFAGSGTTAHSVISLNAEDGGSRRFILVQLPEATGRNDFPTVADITRERVKRASQRIQEEVQKQQGTLFAPTKRQDFGFRYFQLKTSCFAPWNAKVEHGALTEQLKLHISNVPDGRATLEVLFEILLKSGFMLSSPVSARQLNETEVFSVHDGSLLICLKIISKDALIKMAEMKPIRVVCLDSTFAGNDQLKVNAVETFKAKGITFKTV